MNYFIGTNDFDSSFKEISKIEIPKNIDTVYLVSGGWFIVLNDILNNTNIKNIVFYDYNPYMLYVYAIIYNIFLLSESR